MALGSDRPALHADVAEPATEFQKTGELTSSLQSGSQELLLHGRTWDGAVLVCLEVDGDDRAVVEVQCASGPGYDDLATVEQAIAHLEAVRRYLLDLQGLAMRGQNASRELCVLRPVDSGALRTGPGVDVLEVDTATARPGWDR